VSFEFEDLFVIVPQWLLFDGPDRQASPLSDKAIRLYAVLQSWASRDTHLADPKRRVLANAISVSTKTVDRKIDELVEFGALAKTRRLDAAGDFTSSEYLVRARPEFTLWTPVTRGRDTGDATGRDTGDATVGTPVSPYKQDPSELDPSELEALAQNVSDDTPDPKVTLEYCYREVDRRIAAGLHVRNRDALARFLQRQGFTPPNDTRQPPSALTRPDPGDCDHPSPWAIVAGVTICRICTTELPDDEPSAEAASC
jgi:hypothetical protein